VSNDIVALQNKLAPRWQGTASFLANLTTINAIGGMQLGSGGSGPLRFPDVDSGKLLRRPINELSTMDTAGAAASAGNDYVLAYGSFRDAFLIADRIGTQIQLIPSLSDPTTGRPTLSRGATMWFRTGSARIIDSAVQVLTA
jgi:HK97 family phage major capsid protein